jgi:hypothetical protein
MKWSRRVEKTGRMAKPKTGLSKGYERLNEDERKRARYRIGKVMVVVVVMEMEMEMW